jgi:hypothetical protein
LKMRDKLELVARPKGVVETFMDKALVCRTISELSVGAPLAPTLLANLDSLYFIRVIDGPVKIGRSVDAVRRLQHLQSACPYELTLMGTLPGDGEGECNWHNRYAKHRLRGEWFALIPRLRADINFALNGGDWRKRFGLDRPPPSDADWRIGSPLYEALRG